MGYWRFRTWVDKPISNFCISRRYNDPPVRIVRNGVRNEEVFRIFTQNSRFPDLLEGDLNSIMAACELGKQRVESIISKYGGSSLEHAFEEIISQSEFAVKSEIEKSIPDGEWSFRDRIDSDDIILECKNSMSPTIIKSSTDESFLSVIMPLRVEW